jgi:hypothetical protein
MRRTIDMVKTSDTKYQTRNANKKKRVFDFPYTWLCDDTAVGKCKKASKKIFRTWYSSRKYYLTNSMRSPPNIKLLWLTPDNSNTTNSKIQKPRKWLIKQTSSIPNSGYGVFAARPFQVGDVVTKYIGVTADLTTKCGNKKANEWAKETSMHRDYRLILERSGKQIMVAADEYHDYLFGHFFQHSNTPNCVIDRNTGLIYALLHIRRGTELTFEYNKNMQDWLFVRK